MDVSKLVGALSSDFFATVILGLGVEILRRILSAFTTISKQQNDFNANLIRIETRVMSEIEHLKDIAVQHNDRIYELETRH